MLHTGGNLRPWGRLEWLYDRLGYEDCAYIGCIGVEDRALSCYQLLTRIANISCSLLLRIGNESGAPDSDYHEARERRLDEIQDQFGALGALQNSRVFVADLSMVTAIADSVGEFIEDNRPNSVVLDLSCLPKRVFFLLVKNLISSGVRNVLVHYTVPSSYSGASLAYDAQSWSYLPGFLGGDDFESEAELAVVGVGFLPFDLPDIIKGDFAGPQVRYLFPFPPGPPNSRRNWEFISEIHSVQPVAANDISMAGALDLPEQFRVIGNLSGWGRRHTLFAPYGPKIMSLAMCLHAINNDWPVIYTQPSYYDNKYSVGVRRDFRGQVLERAYALKHCGESVFCSSE